MGSKQTTEAQRGPAPRNRGEFRDFAANANTSQLEQRGEGRKTSHFLEEGKNNVLLRPYLEPWVPPEYLL